LKKRNTIIALSSSKSLICWQFEIMCRKWFVHWNTFTSRKQNTIIILSIGISLVSLRSDNADSEIYHRAAHSFRVWPEMDSEMERARNVVISETVTNVQSCYGAKIVFWFRENIKNFDNLAGLSRKDIDLSPRKFETLRRCKDQRQRTRFLLVLTQVHSLRRSDYLSEGPRAIASQIAFSCSTRARHISSDALQSRLTTIQHSPNSWFNSDFSVANWCEHPTVDRRTQAELTLKLSGSSEKVRVNHFIACWHDWRLRQFRCGDFLFASLIRFLRNIQVIVALIRILVDSPNVFDWIIIVQKC
jgi:hypothetical protein